MKTIGLIGGMSWESTADYYRIINETVKKQLGGFHSAKILLYSFDFAEIEFYENERWDKETKAIIEVAKKLEAAGADFIVIACNTAHKTSDEIQNSIGIPLLHIVDVAAEEVKSANIRKVGLLGTKFTMEGDFYAGRLGSHGLEVVVPYEKDRQAIHDVIYNELCLGKINPASKERFKRIIERLVERGADGVILGCTELQMLIKAGDVKVPVFDTTEIHARAAAMASLGSGEKLTKEKPKNTNSIK